jgi:uncharacterized membrane protein
MYNILINFRKRKHVEVIQDVRRQADQAADGYTLSLENLLHAGFNLFRKAPAELIAFSLFGVLVFSNPISGLLLGGPVSACYYHMAKKLSQGGIIEPQDYFKGFEKFGDLLKLNLLILAVVVLGFAMLFVPGIYFAVSYVFAHLFVWFYDMEPTEALRLSRKTVAGNFGQIFLLYLVLAGINLLGVLAFGIGILITMPFSFCVAYAAFDDIIGILK